MRWTVRFLPVLLLAAAVGCEEGTGPDDRTPTDLVITPSTDTLAALQDTVRLRAEVRTAAGGLVEGAVVAWASLDPEVATVDSTGLVVSRESGTARIVASSGSLMDTATVVVLPGVSPAELDFAVLSAAAPPLATRDTSFWVVNDDGGRLEIHFLDEDGDEGDEFFEFEVPGDALLRYPDGRPFAEGDSVEIRVRIDESRRFRFEFEPSGLRFNPERPARLRVRYERAEAEYVARADSLFLWRQETPDSPWSRLATVRVKDLSEVRAEITGFTSFALALPR